MKQHHHFFRFEDEELRDERRFARRGGFGEGHHGRLGGFLHGRGGPHGGFGRGRMFESGDIKFVILKLLSEQPSYGYQLIKTMEQRLSGGYTPSPGAIYPTLTMLEEEGLIEMTQADGKKVYSLTQQGHEFLAANGPQVDALFERVADAGRAYEKFMSPALMKAFGNLRGAIVARVARGNLTEEQVRKIAEAIDLAANTIDEV